MKFDIIIFVSVICWASNEINCMGVGIISRAIPSSAKVIPETIIAVLVPPTSPSSGAGGNRKKEPSVSSRDEDKTGGVPIRDLAYYLAGNVVDPNRDLLAAYSAVADACVRGNDTRRREKVMRQVHEELQNYAYKPIEKNQYAHKKSKQHCRKPHVTKQYPKVRYTTIVNPAGPKTGYPDASLVPISRPDKVIQDAVQNAGIPLVPAYKPGYRHNDKHGMDYARQTAVWNGGQRHGYRKQTGNNQGYPHKNETPDDPNMESQYGGGHIRNMRSF